MTCRTWKALGRLEAFLLVCSVAEGLVARVPAAAEVGRFLVFDLGSVGLDDFEVALDGIGAVGQGGDFGGHGISWLRRR